MPIARASAPYLSACALVALAAFTGWRCCRHPALMAVTVAALAVGAAFAWFFRDPERRFRAAPAIVLSPGDGRVMRVMVAGNRRVIEVFLAIWNVHIQRAPVGGRVTAVDYTKGAYLAAFNPAAGTRNTRCRSVIRFSRGEVAVTQVAGLIARKVECWLTPGRTVERGSRMGLIHLGSQVRVEVPLGARILVKPGDKVKGGLTPVAELRARARSRPRVRARSRPRVRARNGRR